MKITATTTPTRMNERLRTCARGILGRLADVAANQELEQRLAAHRRRDVVRGPCQVVVQRECGRVRVVGDAGVEDRPVLVTALGELAYLRDLEAVALARLPHRPDQTHEPRRVRRVVEREMKR